MTPTGTHFKNYQLCRRKLWLFVNGINVEHTSDAVYDGKLIHEGSYPQRPERYEGEITEAKLKELLQKAHVFMDKTEDIIILFKHPSVVYMDKEVIGSERGTTDIFLWGS